jgi:hypothetical protein
MVTPDLLDTMAVKTEYLAGEEVAALPHAALLNRAKSLLHGYNAAAAKAVGTLITARQKAEAELSALQMTWVTSASPGPRKQPGPTPRGTERTTRWRSSWTLSAWRPSRSVITR